MYEETKSSTKLLILCATNSTLKVFESSFLSRSGFVFCRSSFCVRSCTALPIMGPKSGWGNWFTTSVLGNQCSNYPGWQIIAKVTQATRERGGSENSSQADPMSWAQLFWVTSAGTHAFVTDLVTAFVTWVDCICNFLNFSHCIGRSGFVISTSFVLLTNTSLIWSG